MTSGAPTRLGWRTTTSRLGGPSTCTVVPAVPLTGTGVGRPPPVMAPLKSTSRLWVPMPSPRTMNWPLATPPGPMSPRATLSTLSTRLISVISVPRPARTGVNPAGTRTLAFMPARVKALERLLSNRVTWKNSFRVLMRPSMMMTPGMVWPSGSVITTSWAQPVTQPLGVPPAPPLPPPPPPPPLPPPPTQALPRP